MNDSAFEALSILIVDDDARIRRALARTLELDGHLVTIAATAAEALSVIGSQTWNVVCIDAQLPDLSGCDLAREIRSRGVASLLVAVTGYASTFGDPAFFWPGVDAVLPKPWRASELDEVMRMATEHRRAIEFQAA